MWNFEAVKKQLTFIMGTSFGSFPILIVIGQGWGNLRRRPSCVTPGGAGAGKGSQVPSKVAGKYARWCGNSPGEPMKMEQNGQKWMVALGGEDFAFDVQTIASINAVPILGAWDWWRLGC